METPPPEAIASWLEVITYLSVSAGAILGIGVAIRTLRSPQQVPQPLTVKAETELAKQSDLIEHKNAVEGELHQLHGRISSTRRELTDQVKALDARIDEIPGRTIRLLNETKNLHKSP